MEFELDWRSRHVGPMQTPRRFLDFVVDGESLYDQLGFDLISPLGWGLAEPSAARRLLQKLPPDVDDRVAILVCPEDADLLCGSITAKIRREGDDVVWADLAYSSYDVIDDRWRHVTTGLAEWAELRFPAAAYEDAIAYRPAAAPLAGHAPPR
jgi:hypothetical protein